MRRGGTKVPLETSSSASERSWHALRQLGNVMGIVSALFALALYTYYAGTLIQILRHL
jgi:hypothetical protein